VLKFPLMSYTNDARKLAQLLLKAKRIIREDFDRIISAWGEAGFDSGDSGKGSAKGKKKEQQPGNAVRFIAGLKISFAGHKEKILGEEDIVKVISAASGIPYRKIDPLELDIDTVTRTIPKPFALKHMILPLYQSGD